MYTMLPAVLIDLQDAVLHLPRKQVSIFSTLALGNSYYKTDSSLKYKLCPTKFFFSKTGDSTLLYPHKRLNV